MLTKAASLSLGVAVVLLAMILSVSAHSTGATSESCYDMLVRHGNDIDGWIPPNSCQENCDFSIEVVARVDDNRVQSEANITSYECNATYEVIVKTTGDRFNGFMAEARSPSPDGTFSNSTPIWGEWLTRSSDNYHTVNCNHSLNSAGDEFPGAATQNESLTLHPIEMNENISLYWKAPGLTDGELPESLVFWVTIVESEGTFYYPVNGTQLVRNCQPLSSPTPTLVLVSSSSSTSSTVASSSMDSPTVTMSPTPTMSTDSGSVLLIHQVGFIGFTVTVAALLSLLIYRILA